MYFINHHPPGVSPSGRWYYNTWVKLCQQHLMARMLNLSNLYLTFNWAFCNMLYQVLFSPYSRIDVAKSFQSKTLKHFLTNPLLLFLKSDIMTFSMGFLPKLLLKYRRECVKWVVKHIPGSPLHLRRHIIKNTKW